MSDGNPPVTPQAPRWVKVLALVGLALVLVLGLLHLKHFRHLVGLEHSAPSASEPAP